MVFAQEDSTSFWLVEIDYPEQIYSVAELSSVQVVWAQEMTYCSLITRINLQRFTWLPLTTVLGEQEAILQWDAIRLIEQWIHSNAFFEVTTLAEDMHEYFNDIPNYSLFDMYMYTPHAWDQLTEKDYLFQWHRVVLLYVENTWWVMDPLRWDWTAWWQSRDIYKQHTDPTAYFFVYTQLYTFTSDYIFDFIVDDQKSHVDDLTTSVYKWVIVSELDSAFMPIASSFLQSIQLTTAWVNLSIPAWEVVRDKDMSPFNIWLLHSTLEINAQTGQITIDIALAGKTLLFSLPVETTVSLASLFPEKPSGEYLITKEPSELIMWACDDGFAPDGTKKWIIDREYLAFTVCHTGKYSITYIPMEE